MIRLPAYACRSALLMSLALPTFAIDATSSSAPTHAAEPGWPAITREARPWTFNWWLGSAVDEAHLAHELDRYRDAGLGGIHIIPIYAAKGAEARQLPFLGPEWLRMIDWTIAAAEQRGLGVDLTTGTGWCFGGPDISASEGGQRLVLINAPFPADGVLPQPPKNFATIAWQSFAAVSATGARQDLHALAGPDGKLGWTPPDGALADWSVVAVGTQPTNLKVKRAGPGGEGRMINPLDPAVMENYLAPFRAAFAADSGHARPRAMYHDSFEYYEAAWSPAVSAEFARRRGYRLEDHWSLLAGHGEPDQVARLWHDYRRTLSDLMVENVFPQWIDWARAGGMSTRFQAHGAAGNLLDLYALAEIPETEMFGHGGPDPLDSRFDEHIGKADRDIQVSKFASSAAHVAGRRFVSAETGTWLAEHFHETFEELKAFTDRLFIAGVNHVFYHGNAYSPDDIAWPGWLFYASSQLNTRNPLWREFAALNAYVTRVQSVLQSTEPDNDFLLYWPIGDTWSDPKPGVSLLTVHNNAWVPALGRRLFDEGHAFDYVSDRQIAALQTRVDGGLSAPGATYRALVFPDTKTLPLETIRHALRLAGSGATIGLATPVADDVPGLLDVDARRAELRALLPDLAGHDPDELVEIPRGRGRLLVGPAEKILARAGIAPEPAILAHPGLLMLRKKRGDDPVYLVVNHSLRPLDAWVPLARAATRLDLMNPLDGTITVGAVRPSAAGGTEVRLYLEPGHSVLLRTPGTDLSPRASAGLTRPGKILRELETPWRVDFIAGGPELPAAWETARPGSWTDGADLRREAFGGTARYATRFDFPEALGAGARELLLDLGEVAHVARVRLNDRDLGVAFMRPYRLTVPAGTLLGVDNRLEIEVTNLAANRIRDLERRGVTWRNFFFVNIRYKDFDPASWPVAPSGLLGPVVIRTSEPIGENAMNQAGSMQSKAE